MRISKETIKHFANKGISVRWYAEKTYEEFKKNQWDKEYKIWFDYSKNSCKELNPPRNDGSYQSWNYETVAEYEKEIKKFCDRIIDRHCEPYEYNRLYIEYDGKLIIKKENVKSKEITIEMIDKLIAKNEKAYSGYYGEFAKNMQKLLNENGLTDKFSVYPTTYGIGIWVIFNYSAKDEIKKVTKILNDRGIEYYNEYSEAGWVYRYKVSKKADNIAKAA
jgi:hypothetical protein